MPTAVAIQPLQFRTHFDSSFGRLEETTWKKVSQATWNVFSVLIPIIALSRWGSRKITASILLPAVHIPAQEIQAAKKSFYSFFESEQGKNLPFHLESHKVTTPDNVSLSAHFFRHKEADSNTPTLIYFNPNCALSYQIPYSELMNECISRNAVCNFAVFDYRNTGDSEGTFRKFDDLVIDGASIVQWVREKIGTPSDKIHFYGWSMGGAVAVEVKALNPELTKGDLVNERSLSSTDDMIDQMYESQILYKKEKIPSLENIKKLISKLLDSINVVPAFKRLIGRALVVYHPKDPVIPFSASLERRIQEIPHQALCLESEQNGNHHCLPLDSYRDANTGKPAMEVIGDFFFSK